MRAFSTTASRKGISDVYSKLMRWSTTPKTEVAQDTKLYDPTKETVGSRDEMPDDSAPRKLRVLGKPRDSTADLQWVKENFTFDAWPTTFYRKDLTKQQVDSALEGASFSTVQDRFNTIKTASSQLNIAIPDYALAFSSINQLKQHLYSAAKEFNENTPDAVYLNREEFKGLNITIEPTPSELKELKARNKRLIKEAETAQEQQLNKLLE